MKKIIYSVLAMAIVFLLASCDKFTDITPKGKNLLGKVTDLETILNFNFSQNGSVQVGSAAGRTTAEDAFVFDDVNLLINDIYPYVQNVNTVIAAPTKTLTFALLTSNESVDRKVLATADIKYSKMYFIINNVANAVLANADQATGDRAKVTQFKAEALILRAYFHYLLVNLYAKAYNPVTAATDGGIPYVKEDNILSEANVKSTVAEVYANILSDIDAAFQLNSLPATNVNPMRVGLGFAYAVRARVLLSMRRYPEALAAANSSLNINSVIEDHRNYAPVGTTAFTRTAASLGENLFYAAGTSSGPSFRSMSFEIANNYYEAGNIIKNYVKPYDSGDGLTGIVGSQLWYTFAFAFNSGGLTSIDSYLVKAECLLRAGSQQNIPGGMEIINQIRQKRNHPTGFTLLAATTEAQAMAHLKKLSRIEFLYTVKNFLNIKRWNTEDAYKETITRTFNGATYQLKPESPLWIFPFPQNATSYNPNLSQNY